MKKMWLAIFIPWLLVSCATDKTLVKEDRLVQQQVAEKESRDKICLAPTKDNYPIWVYQPNYGGVLGAVGIAKKQEKGGYVAQKRLAIIIAQAEIAKQIEVMVNTELQTEKTMINQDYYSKFSSLSRQETQQLIKNAVVKDEWIHPETGDLYIWVVIAR
ncbi:MAG: hypothetical protein V1749_04920 [Candidatus Desantisbacteria bacterium]